MSLPDEVLRGLMETAENMQPVIEWAEGQRLELQQRRWSAVSAETYALELLLGVARMMFVVRK